MAISWSNIYYYFIIKKKNNKIFLYYKKLIKLKWQWVFDNFLIKKKLGIQVDIKI